MPEPIKIDFSAVKSKASTATIKVNDNGGGGGDGMDPRYVSQESFDMYQKLMDERMKHIDESLADMRSDIKQMRGWLIGGIGIGVLLAVITIAVEVFFQSMSR
ncbi:hypothetical protein [Lacticaseibacillus suibinensis]|uniref:hypothetical protein n=1 Tax=Lacticaseibacillus suibinensis TaxID=2486011 RepID=UPI000F776286|nr:hypothetical protein [Lacticaseibacillus suibinensis]